MWEQRWHKHWKLCIRIWSLLPNRVRLSGYFSKKPKLSISNFRISNCGSNIKENCTYVSNPGYPSTYSNSATCLYRVRNQRPIVCQLRFDFVQLNMQKTAGVCVDGLTIDGPTRRDPNQLCGNLANQHIYVETGRSSSPTTLTFDAGDSNNQWRIKVTYIECNNPSR